MCVTKFARSEEKMSKISRLMTSFIAVSNNNQTKYCSHENENCSETGYKMSKF